MKRIVLFLSLAIFAVALVSAQGNGRWGGQSSRGHGFSHGESRHHAWGNRDFNRNSSPQMESTRVSGNLGIAQGMIAVTSDNTTYLVKGLNRYIGFIDGFKEGAAVTIEGYALPSQDPAIKFLQAQKMTLNGKDYDLAPVWQVMGAQTRGYMNQKHRGTMR